MSARDIDLVLAAQEARADLAWMEAAVLFTEAADAEDRPGGKVGATELGLRRDAYLCLNRTQQFIDHRKVMRKRRMLSDDYSEDWRQPDGDLVRSMAAPCTDAKRIFLRREVAR